MRVYRGVIPWSVAEYDWILAAFDKRKLKNENLGLPEEFAEHKEEFETSKGRELENIKDMILFSDIFIKDILKNSNTTLILIDLTKLIIF